MEAKFIGSMVSIDCGEVLGIYQGLLDGVDLSKQMLTIVNAFHNGSRCSMPHITINASDIRDLKIIKDVAEAKLIVAATGQQRSKRASDAQTVANTRQNDRHITSKTQDESIASLQHVVSDTVQTGASNTDSSKRPNVSGFKPYVSASPRKAAVKTASRGSNYKKTQSSVNDTRSSPYKKLTNGCAQNENSSGTARVKGADAGRTNGCSPNDLAASMHAVTVSDALKSSDCFPENSQRSVIRKRTNSASDLMSSTRNGWKGSSNHCGARGPGVIREDCFAVPIDSIVDDEFDFEKNLALFDKRAVFDKIERQREQASLMTGPTVSAAATSSSPRPTDTKYRCDENILPSRKAVYRQILTSQTADVVGTGEYVTDSGLVIPCVLPALRDRLLAAARRSGFSRERHVEMVGRSAAEMVLQLLGGGNRFDPKNMHQCPQVVVLCGTASQAAFGLNCARQLASRRIHLTVFLPDTEQLSDGADMELKLLHLAGSKLTTADYKSLPSSPVDVIVSAFDSADDAGVSREPWHQSVVDWASVNKAPVLSLDPPSEHVAIESKWSLAVALPLAYSDRCGQIYLCDLGLPARLYREAGLKSYQSPFAHKFVIPLHSS